MTQHIEEARKLEDKCPGADDPEERCPRNPSECTCWNVDLGHPTVRSTYNHQGADTMTRPTVLDMDIVVVPRDATDEMLSSMGDMYMPFGEMVAAYDGAIFASPYPTAWDDVRKYVEGLKKDKHAALTMIAMLEKRLADAERVIEPFADGRAKTTHTNGCRYHGGHDCDCGKDDYIRAARAYMGRGSYD